MDKGKRIFFYNAIPMPHSILLHKKLVEAGFHVDFWYYKGLTKLYPWSSLDGNIQYNIYNKSWTDCRKIFQQSRQSNLMVITGWHTLVHLFLIVYAFVSRKKMALWLDVHEVKISRFTFFRNKCLIKMASYLFVTGSNGIDMIHHDMGINKRRMKNFPYLTAEFDADEMKEINSLRSRQLAEGCQIKLLISNRFIVRKGYAIIIEALSKMPAALLQKFDITVLGIGPDFEMYREQFEKIRTTIFLRGWIEYEGYLQEMKQTDVFLHASLAEPYGIPPMDAICCGKLVIGSSGVISCRDKIVSGTNGFLYPKDDAQQLCSILSNVAENPQQIYEIGGSALITAASLGYQHNINVVKEVLAF